MSIGIVLGTYFLDIISKITQKAEYIGFISPFKYVDTDVLVVNYSLNPNNVLFFLLVTVILTLLSVKLFLRKDILN
jgi:ABC-2 type transport system permease protein